MVTDVGQTGKKVLLSKPHPYMLDSLAERFRDIVKNFYFIGDMTDDMVAASRSKFFYNAIGFISISTLKNSEREKIKRALLLNGAKRVFSKPYEIKKFLNKY